MIAPLALVGDSIPYDRAFGALIARFLSITKCLTEKKRLSWDLHLDLLLDIQMHNHHGTLKVNKNCVKT